MFQNAVENAFLPPPVHLPAFPAEVAAQLDGQNTEEGWPKFSSGLLSNNPLNNYCFHLPGGRGGGREREAREQGKRNDEDGGGILLNTNNSLHHFSSVRGTVVRLMGLISYTTKKSKGVIDCLCCTKSANEEDAAKAEESRRKQKPPSDENKKKTWRKRKWKRWWRKKQQQKKANHLASLVSTMSFRSGLSSPRFHCRFPWSNHVFFSLIV